MGVGLAGWNRWKEKNKEQINRRIEKNFKYIGYIPVDCFYVRQIVLQKAYCKSVPFLAHGIMRACAQI